MAKVVARLPARILRCSGAVLMVLVGFVYAQSSTSFWDQFIDVTTPKSNGFGPIFKCGEGNDTGKRICVPYQNCDHKSKQIIAEEDFNATDGSYLIDIRFGTSSCDHPLAVCCNIPPGGIPPGVLDNTDGGSTSIPEPGPTPIPGPGPTPNPITRRPPVTKAPGTSYCGMRNENGIDFKIVGNNNNEAEFGEFPWMTAVLRKTLVGNQTLALCGGSLIAPNVVLTGAHCVAKEQASELKVRVGEWDTQTERERLPYQEIDVTEIIVHEGFKPTNLFNDVGLLILANPVVKYEHIGTICLPQQNFRFIATDCFATGWGKDLFGAKGRYQVILKKIQLPIVPRDRCQEMLRKTRLGPNFRLHTSFTCAGGEPGKDTCTGDGGGPLVCPDPNRPSRYMQTGIVAWGIGCGEEGVPGVYADVSQFRDWIDSHMKRLNIDTSSYTN